VYNTVAVSQLARVVSTLHVPQSRLGRGNPPDLLWGLLAGNMQGLMNWVVSLCHGAAARLRHEHTRRARGTGLYCEHSYADVIVYSRLLDELHYTIHWGRETRCRNRILQAQLTLVRLSASPATKQVCRQLLNREKSSQSIPRKANNESQSSTKHQKSISQLIRRPRRRQSAYLCFAPKQTKHSLQPYNETCHAR